MFLPADHPSRAAEPWLVYDNRDALRDQDVMHVLIGGTSHYPKLPAAGEPDTEHGHGMHR